MFFLFYFILIWDFYSGGAGLVFIDIICQNICQKFFNTTKLNNISNNQAFYHLPKHLPK